MVPIAAVITCGAWLLWGNRHDALQATIAVLLSASASSLALSARAALQVGCAQGARQGVLIGSGAAAENATLVTTIALDKAASITPGLPAVVELIPYDGVRRDELLATAAGAAQFGDDPLSVCIHAEAKRRGLRMPRTRSHSIVPGQGICARTLTGETMLGLDTWLAMMQVDVSPLAGRLSAIRAAGQSAYVVSVGTRLFGALVAADVVAPYSRQAVGQLRAMGLRVVLLSADSPAITAAATREVTFDQVISGVSPDRKPAIIAQLRAPGAQVAMVGTGVGDEASLAAADLGIALDAEGNVTIDSADIILPGDLRGVGRAILLSRAIFGTIRTNLGFAVVYNALLIPLAAAGLPGVIAAAATTIASVAVVANSLLLLRKRID
ncbi:MAG: HAD-IC family P-type ATPase [Planctomycetes bacterium]|nr:HAD-IC family P-type ATPase [Planctomycetota bacterium]